MSEAATAPAPAQQAAAEQRGGAVRRQARRAPAEDKPAEEKQETLRIVSIKGDGRCMFRAISQGIAMGKGRGLFAAEEERQADLLRMACAEAICASAERREKFPEALVAIKSEDELPSYCKRIVEPSFWGGEAELLVISRMLKQPIKVYMKNKKLGGPPFRSIQEYGMDYANPRTLKSGKVAPGKPAVKLLYNGSSHYELLVKRGRL